MKSSFFVVVDKVTSLNQLAMAEVAWGLGINTGLLYPFAGRVIEKRLDEKHSNTGFRSFIFFHFINMKPKEKCFSLSFHISLYANIHCEKNIYLNVAKSTNTFLQWFVSSSLVSFEACNFQFAEMLQ